MAKRGGKRHSPEQIVQKLLDTDALLTIGKDLVAVLQTLEVSEQTYYRWKNQSGGMKLEEAKRLQRFARVVRSHWAVENQLHWVLDVEFAADASRISSGLRLRLHPKSNYGGIRGCKLFG